LNLNYAASVPFKLKQFLGVVQVLQLRTTQQLGSLAKTNDEARAP
jgi:hypothetical protein